VDVWLRITLGFTKAVTDPRDSARSSLLFALWQDDVLTTWQSTERSAVPARVVDVWLGIT